MVDREEDYIIKKFYVLVTEHFIKSETTYAYFTTQSDGVRGFNNARDKYVEKLKKDERLVVLKLMCFSARKDVIKTLEMNRFHTITNPEILKTTPFTLEKTIRYVCISTKP